MTILRSRLNQLDAFGNRKNGLSYEYGGDGDGPAGGPSGDCSWAAAAAAAIIIGQSPARRYGSTETWRLTPQGRPGPLGTIRGRGPDDAVLRLGFMHGGGGANSHVACTINYGSGRLVNFESRGMPGGVIYGTVVRGGKRYYARGWNDQIFHDFWHVPGPIVEDTNGAPPPPPLAGGVPFIRIGSVSDEVRTVQARLNRDYPAYSALVVDGEFGPATDRVVREFQRRSGLEVDGIVGPATWKRLGL